MHDVESHDGEDHGEGFEGVETGFVVGERVGGCFAAGEFDEAEDDADLLRGGGGLVLRLVFGVEFGFGFGER
jgi:hypothetical protein